MVLINNTKSKTNKNKVYNKNKQDKYFVFKSQNCFTKFKDIDEFKELSLDSMYKELNDLKKKDLISLRILFHKEMKLIIIF